MAAYDSWGEFFEAEDFSPGDEATPEAAAPDFSSWGSFFGAEQPSSRLEQYMAEVPETKPPTPSLTAGLTDPIEYAAQTVGRFTHGLDKSEGVVGDMFRLGQAGLGDTAKAIQGGLTYFVENIDKLAPAGTGKVAARAPRDVEQAAKEYLEERTKLTQSFIEDRISELTPQQKEALKKEWATFEDPAWQDPRAVAGALTRSLPLMLPSIAGGAVTGAGASAALVGLGIEGVLMGGLSATTIREQIEAIPHEKLLKDAPGYAAYYEQTGDRAQALDSFVADAREWVPALIAAGSTIAGKAGGKVLGGLANRVPGEGIPSRALRAGVTEGGQETLQGPTEQLGENIAAQEYDPSRELTTGLAEATVSSAVLGPLAGAAVGVPLGGGRREGAPPPSPSRPLPEVAPQEETQAVTSLEEELAEVAAEEPVEPQGELALEGGEAARVPSPNVGPLPLEAKEQIPEEQGKLALRRAPKRKKKAAVKPAKAKPAPEPEFKPPPPKTAQELADEALASTEQLKQRRATAVQRASEIAEVAISEAAPDSPTANMRPVQTQFRQTLGRIGERMVASYRRKDKQAFTEQVTTAVEDAIDGLTAGQNLPVLTNVSTLLDRMERVPRGREAAAKIEDALASDLTVQEKLRKVDGIVDSVLGRQANFQGARTRAALDDAPAVKTARKALDDATQLLTDATSDLDKAVASVEYARANDALENAEADVLSSRKRTKPALPASVREGAKKVAGPRTQAAQQLYDSLVQYASSNPDSLLYRYLTSRPVVERFKQNRQTPRTHLEIDAFLNNAEKYAKTLETDTAEVPFDVASAVPPRKKRAPKKEPAPAQPQISEAETIERVGNLQRSKRGAALLERYRAAPTDREKAAVLATEEWKAEVEKAGLTADAARDVAARSAVTEAQQVEEQARQDFADAMSSEALEAELRNVKGVQITDQVEEATPDDAANEWLKAQGLDPMDMPVGVVPPATDSPMVAGISAQLLRNYVAVGRPTTGAEVLNRFIRVLPDGVERDAAVMLTQNIDPRFARSIDISFEPETGSDAVGQYFPDNGEIILYHGTDVHSANFVRAMVHELTHASIDYGLRQKKFSDAVSTLRNSVSGVFAQYGQKNNHEFIAEAMANPQFQTKLRKTRVSVQDRLKLRGVLGNQVPLSRLQTVWQAFKELVAKLLFLKPPPNQSVYTYAMQAQRLLAQAQGEARAPDTHLTPFPETFSDGDLDPDIFNLTIPAAAQGAARRARGSILGGLAQKAGLTVYSFDQLDESYGDTYDPVRQLHKEQTKRVATSRNVHKADAKLGEHWGTLAQRNPAAADIMNNLMLESTRLGYDPSKPLRSFVNRDVYQRNVNAQGKVIGYSIKRRYARTVPRLKARYNNLPAEFKQLYKDVEKSYADAHTRIRSQAVKNYLDASPYNLTTSQQLRLKLAMMDVRNAEGDFDYTPYGVTVGQSSSQKAHDEFVAGLDTLRKSVHTRGPYFPLNRDGEWVVEGSKETTRSFQTKAARDIAIEDILGDDPAAKIEKVKGGFDINVTEKVVSFFDSQYEANQFADEINAGQGQWQGWKSRSGSKASLKQKMDILSGSGGAQQVQQRLRDKFKGDPAAEQRIVTAMLEFLPESGALRQAVRRRNIRGASSDMLRAFAKNTHSASWAYSQLKHGVKISDIKAKFGEDIKNGVYADTNEASLLLHTMHQRDMVDAQPPGTFERVESFLMKTGFFYFLVSPSYSLVNATQPFLYTIPWLAQKHGARRAFKEVGRAWASVVGTPVGQVTKSGLGVRAAAADSQFTAENAFEQLRHNVQTSQISDRVEMDSMLKWLEQSGQIDTSLVMSLDEAASAVGATKAGRAASHIERAARFMPQMAELLNRSTTAIAAWRLAKQDGKTEAQARDAALWAIKRTQFDYNMTNRAPALSGRLWGHKIPLWGAVMMFKTHMFGVTNLALSMLRDATAGSGKTADRKGAAKGLALFTLMHGLLAGTVGGLAMEPIRVAWKLFEAIWGMFDDDEEVKQPIDVRLRQMGMEAASMLSSDPDTQRELETLISRGIPAYLGVDISSRVGLQQMFLPRSMMGSSARSSAETVERTVVELLGPLGSAGINIFRGMDYIKSGQPMKGLEAMMPKLGRDVTRAFRTADEGMTNYRGAEVMAPETYGALEAFTRAMGFSPTIETNLYDEREAVVGQRGRLNTQREALRLRYLNAAPDERQGVLDDIRRFNRDNPPAFRLTRSSILRSRRSRRKSERDARRGRFIERKYYRALRREAEFAR